MTSHMPKPPYDVPNAVYEKARQIKLALFDVDGVLTDGSLYFDSHGETLKVFNAKDGHGMKLLQENGIEVGIITARESAALGHRVENLGIRHCLTGQQDKIAAFEALCESLKVEPSECCYTGDDAIDLEVMRACELSFSVDDAHYTAKQTADWVAPFNGGRGAVRAICDILIYAKQS